MDNKASSPRCARHFALSLVAFWLFCTLNALLRLTYVPESGHVPYPIGLDANCYYAYARSLFFDHDLNFANDYAFIVRTQPAGTSEPFAEFLKSNPRNPPNVFNAGTGIAALPALAAAKLYDSLYCALTGATPASPFSSLYVFAFFAASITYAAAALWLTFGILRRWHDPSYAAAACWATLLCGPMLFYTLIDNAMSHCTAAFFGTAAIAAWLQWREAHGKRVIGFAALTGWCVGFAACVRPYNAPVALILVEPLLRKLIKRIPFAANDFAAFLAAVLGLLVGFLPQVVAWHSQSGHWFANTTGYAFHVIPPFTLHVLFAPRHGLFFWAPALLIAMAGLLRSAARRPHPAAALLAIFAGVTYMYGNWHYYWLGVAFGMRGYVDYPYIFAFGFAAAIAWIAERLQRRATIIAWEIIALFFVINLHLLVAFTGGVVWVDGPLDWLETISRGRDYKAQLHRLAAPWTDFNPEHRTSLFSPPPP